MTDGSDHRRPLWLDVVLLCLAAAAFGVMILLGNWQVARLSWKQDLIERVEAHAFGDPIPISAQDAPTEYLRVTATGTFRHDKALLVKAVTELGPGRWVVTPLITTDGPVWVNRGFVPAGLGPDDIVQPAGPQRITGLLRLSDQGGTLLEQNDPAAGRWVAFDLGVMSGAAGIPAGADFYIAADHAAEAQAWPRGGLTKLEFRNAHLSYALTWYAMAALFLGAMWYVIRDRLHRRQDVAD